MSEAEVREKLRAWILARAKSAPSGPLEDETPILEAGFLSSLDVVELILFIERLSGKEVDVDAIEPEVLTSIDTLYEGFFAPAGG